MSLEAPMLHQPPLKQMMSLTTDATHSPVRQHSRMRSPFADMVTDLFRAPEDEIKSAAYDFIRDHKDLVNLEELDQWERRPSGVLVVGSSKALLSRLIKGDSIKNQAIGAIRTATGNVTYLNLSQLIMLRQHCEASDLQRSGIPEIRDFANCMEEALNEKLMSTLLHRSNLYYSSENEEQQKIEAFTNAERKFLGRRLLLHVGALRRQLATNASFSFNVENSDWFLFCGTKNPETIDEVRGLFFEYPSLKVFTERRRSDDKMVYCLGEVRDTEAFSASAGQHVTWHVLACQPIMGIDELVRASMSFKNEVVSKHPKAGGGRFRTQTSAGLAKSPSMARDAPLKDGCCEEEEEEVPPTPDTVAPQTPSGDASGQQTTNEDDSSVTAQQQPEAPADDEGAAAAAAEEVAVPAAAEEAAAEGEEEAAAAAAEGEEEEAAAGEEEEYWGAPIEYDEAVPTYYDIWQETYYYYGNVLYFDPDWSAYYYYDWEQESYVYIDEETQAAINEGTIPVWNQEDGQYYDASAYWTEEAEGEAEAEQVESPPEGEDSHVEATQEEEEDPLADGAAAAAAADASEADQQPQQGDDDDKVAEQPEAAAVETPTEVTTAAAATPTTEATATTTPTATTPTAVAVEEEKVEEALAAVVDKEEGGVRSSGEVGVTELGESTAAVEVSRGDVGNEQTTSSPDSTAEKSVTEATAVVSSSSVGENKPGEVRVDLVIERQDSLLAERKAGGSLTRAPVKSPVAAPPRVSERFSGSIDQFQSSESMLINRALKEIICQFDSVPHLLQEYERRPNGLLRVGRNKRIFDNLIKGSLELKSLTATDCADVASNLALLNLPQLLHIRRNAQNSAWDKSPLATLKTFAMKTDSLIAEKFAFYLLQRGDIADEVDKYDIPETSTEAYKRLKLLSAPECRHMGSQAIFVVGSMAELRHAKVRIQGEDYAAGRTPTPQSSWWFLSSNPIGAGAIPRTKVEGPPKGMFYCYPELKCTFERPPGLQSVFKLVAGRQHTGFLAWDILEITL